jgi:hypothetical protein
VGVEMVRLLLDGGANIQPNNDNNNNEPNQLHPFAHGMHARVGAVSRHIPYYETYSKVFKSMLRLFV